MIGAQFTSAAGMLLADPFPSDGGPSDGGGFTSVSVSPGLGGFLAMFILAVAVVLLVLDMTRRTRRVKARAAVQERMDAEQAERDATAAASEGEDAPEGTAGPKHPGGPSDVDDAEGQVPRQAAEESSLETSGDVAGIPVDPRPSPAHDVDRDADGSDGDTKR